MIDWRPGSVPELVAPIPPVSLFPLPALASLAWREWVLMLEGDELAMFGHTFEVRGWQVAPVSGLMVVHTCCGSHL